jgi:Uma2 family endonuclease
MLLSAVDLLALSTCWERLELIDGRVTPRPALGFYSSVITTRLAIKLATSADVRESAAVLQGAGFILNRGPDTVLCPNLSISYLSRYPNGKLPDGFVEFAPDLSCDTLYPEDRLPILEWRAKRFLDAGVARHWIIDAFARTITVYSLDDPPYTLQSGDSLSVDPFLPGIAISIDEIFKL